MIIDYLAQAVWLDEHRATVDTKDLDTMADLAAEYSKRFGIVASLHKCIPVYGPDKGQFVGYNICKEALYMRRIGVIAAMIKRMECNGATEQQKQRMAVKFFTITQMEYEGNQP